MYSFGRPSDRKIPWSGKVKKSSLLVSRQLQQGGPKRRTSFSCPSQSNEEMACEQPTTPTTLKHPSDSPSPEQASFLPSRLVFAWFDKFVWKARKAKSLGKSDLLNLDKDLQSKPLCDEFSETWMAKENYADSPYRLLRCLIFNFRRFFVFSGICHVIAETCVQLTPSVLEFLLGVVERREQNISTPNDELYGYLACVGMFFLLVTKTIFGNRAFFLAFRTGLKIRSSLSSAVYTHLLDLSSAARQIFPVGRTVKIISADVMKIDGVFGYIHYLWLGPFQIIFTFTMLYLTIGFHALISLGLLLLAIPIQVLLTKLLINNRYEVGLATDKRIRLLQEMILGSRVIKLYGWEALFLKRLEELRLTELSLIRNQCLISGLSVVLSVAVPSFSTIMAFISYTLAGNPLVASIVAPVMFYFSILDIPLGNIPLLVNAMIDSRESLRRIQAFLLSERLGDKIKVDSTAGKALTIKGGNFVWETSETHHCPSRKKPALKPKPVSPNSENDASPTSGNHPVYPCRMLTVTPSTAYDMQEHAWVDRSANIEEPENFALKSINLEIPKGKLVAIVGPVGSGKSSLLMAILGEMKSLTGEITIGGDISYSPQKSWIMNGSVRDNILFGRDFDEARYWTVIKQCAIEHDLMGLPHGDHTLIGDKGINLSGGQKARINLARAVYGMPQIALLDDPLSAVDAKVANVMFYKCICDGLLKGTTRLLVTHQLSIVPYADYVVVMRNGRIEEQGTYEELMTHGTSFSAMMTKFIGEDLAKESSYEEVIEEDDSGSEETLAFDESSGSLNYDNMKSLAHANVHASSKAKPPSKGMYRFYFELAGGWVTILFAFLVVGVNEFVRIGNDLWLMTVWAEGLFGLSTRTYQLIYASFGLGLAVMTWISIVVFVMAGYVAAKRFHEKAVNSLFRSPISFFESTPIGRIVNRFSRDLEVIDAPLPDAIFFLMYVVGMLISTVLIILCSSYQAFGALLVALGLIFTLQYLYTLLIRKLTKLYNGSINPFMTHVSETYSGLSVIRVFNNEGIMLRKFHELSDEVTKVGFVMTVLKRWTSVRAELTGALLVFISSVLALYLRISSSLTGLLISHILLAINFVDFLVKQYAEVEINMVAVSRLSQYANELESEAMDETELPNLDPSWPKSGAIQFENLTITYKPHLPPVIHGISADIKHGEKIAVIGRTGAGKSTILSAIFRMVEPSQGTILVDGVDIRKISLKQLRARLTIIPQEPVLFSGTLRFNLDPEGAFSDAAIWDALEMVNSRGFVAKLSDKLETAVQDFGENFSLGQRQLICLARAILRKSPLVLLDEPTASMDLETDEMVQEAIRKCFKDSTVISISHRLGGIESFDRVMVMDSGRIIEFAEPEVLLADPSTLLSQMVAEYSQF